MKVRKRYCKVCRTQDLDGGSGYCADCRALIRHCTGLVGSHRQVPLPEEAQRERTARLARYCQRAAQGLPLFEEVGL